ncbi:MAG TPA: hypothetical protein EYP36_03895 [Calditrichaeota bacterium]|nr:hypothetical protein [Calditrichota bacterium]
MSDSRIRTILNFIILNIFRNLLGILRSKIIAVFHGVSQIGLLGQFLTFNNLQSRVVTFGITASLINSYNYAKIKNWSKDEVIAFNIFVVLAANLINTILIGVFISALTVLIYGSLEFKLFIWLGLLLNYIYSFSSVLELSVQAEQKFNLLWKARGWGILVALITVVPLTYYFSVLGIIFNLIILYCISFLFLLTRGKLRFNIKKAKLLFKFNKDIASYVLKVAATDIVRSLFVLGSLFLVRVFILHYFDLVTSGYFQAIVSISNYSNILAEGFIVYYFPTISSIKNNDRLRQEMAVNLEILLYIIVPFIGLLMVFSRPVLNILFSSEFILLQNYLEVLLSAKIFYLLYYFYSINFLARNFLKKFIILEGLRSVLLIGLVMLLSKLFAFPGAVYAVLLTDILSVFLIFVLSHKLEYFKIAGSNLKLLVSAFILILILFLIDLPIVLEMAVLLVLFVLFFDVKKYKQVISRFVK